MQRRGAVGYYARGCLIPLQAGRVPGRGYRGFQRLPCIRGLRSAVGVRFFCFRRLCLWFRSGLRVRLGIGGLPGDTGAYCPRVDGFGGSSVRAVSIAKPELAA
jgi:hypothetical protein